MKDIRKLYLEFFEKKGHKVYDSMPLVPDDASLLFTNAGMVQFKDIFTGTIPTPTPPRATSSQLCIRAGGKHNDLENVGHTARHHTLFEMLGNFSFGDYFKKDAIAYAWEFVTQILEFDKSVIYVSVHKNDEEAFNLWCEHIEPSRIKKMDDKDNFWQMGDSGPCGYCSEIYIDQGESFNGSEDYFGGDGDRFLEIWNLVFMEFEQKDGVRTKLPKPSIDTGMGLERVMALLEGKKSNFDSSAFMPIIHKVEEITQKTYIYDSGASFRVIADHARSVAFLLAQGVNFDKDGRGYVLRRILRRAIRHGYLLGIKKPFLHTVIETVCDLMGGHYTYLLERKDTIMQSCYTEEEHFFETLENGMSLFNKELQKLTKNLSAHKMEGESAILNTGLLFSGDVAFKLYDTFGFPLDLTQDMLKESELEVDIETFEKCMQTQKSRSKASWKGSGDSSKDGDFKALLAEFGENKFVGYEYSNHKTRILALLDSEFRRVSMLNAKTDGYVLLESTPFYPQSGGPVGDKGILLKEATDYNFNKFYNDTLDSKTKIANSQILADVLDTQKYFNLNLSKIKTLKDLSINQEVNALVDSQRLEIIKHHSATHLLHLALRSILGTHIAQAGSLVESNRLRFDFSHPKALSQSEIEKIESFVNAEINKANPQICETMGINEAKAKGAMALFGEKYAENVRVISLGDSIELCGGIHVKNTAEIGSFYIIKESSVSSGVRRIEAVCGLAAYAYAKNALKILENAKATLKTKDVLDGIEKLKTKLSESKLRAKETKQSSKSLEYEEIGGVKCIVSVLDSVDSDEAKNIVDNAKNENKNVAILLITQREGKISLTAGVKNAPLNANVWVKAVAKLLGGGGGGRDDFATAGGKDGTKIAEALELAKKIARENISA